MKGSSVYQGALSPTDSISPAPVSPEHGINLTSFVGSTFIPFDSRVIHFIDEDNHMFDTSRFYQHCVFTSLTAPLEARFKFTFASRYDGIILNT